MTETEFLVQADKILNKVQACADDWFENLDVDVDVNREAYVLTLILMLRVML